MITTNPETLYHFNVVAIEPLEAIFSVISGKFKSNKRVFMFSKISKITAGIAEKRRNDVNIPSFPMFFCKKIIACQESIK